MSKKKVKRKRIDKVQCIFIFYFIMNYELKE